MAVERLAIYGETVMLAVGRVPSVAPPSGVGDVVGLVMGSLSVRERPSR